MSMKRCPSCGALHRKGTRVLVAEEGGRGLVNRMVCSKCASSAVRILVEPPVRVEPKTVVEALCECGAKAVLCVGCALNARRKLEGLT